MTANKIAHILQENVFLKNIIKIFKHRDRTKDNFGGFSLDTL